MIHQLKRLALGIALVATCIFATAAKADTIVEPSLDSADWLQFMNVFETPANGGGFVFGDPWNRDYVANSPNDIGGFFPHGIEFRSASIDDPDPFWFVGGGGPGAVGNKVMEANLFQEFAEGSTGALGGMDLIFNYQIKEFSFDQDVQAFAFIKEFEPGFTGVFSQTLIPITGTGNFTISQAIDGSQGAVQFGFQTINTVVWSPDDVYVNGSMKVGLIPEPTSAALLGLAAVGLVARRRR